MVIATGVHTFFGKAAHLVDSTNQVGHFQQARKDLFIYIFIFFGILLAIPVIRSMPLLLIHL